MAGRKPKLKLDDVAKVRSLPTAKKTYAKRKKASTIDEIFDAIISEGAEKYIQELMSLTGKDYVTNFNAIMEYIKPKLARTENIGDAVERAITINMIAASNDKQTGQIEAALGSEDNPIMIE